jgi:putative nucleotidyltransferase with HDIG domain
VPNANLGVAAVLVGLGLLAEVFSFYEKGRHASSSVAFIPYAASIFALPDARSVALIAIAQLIVQFWHRRSPLKSVFNVAQFSLATAVALAVWVAAIPENARLAGVGFLEACMTLGIAAILSYLALSVVNTACISAVMSAATGQRLRDLLRASLRPSFGLTVLPVVFAFFLAWLTATLGLLGAVVMLLPIAVVRQLMRTAAELTNVTEELLDLMVAAIEARDPYTSGHSKRVAQAAVIIARAIGLKDDAVERVQVAALLHDVGKIDERFARILAKEGRLTPDEWDTMKQHPIRSAELVQKISSLRDVVPAIRHHHENWDGTGYPDCIIGERIPLASRIIMFADTLDAITTDRPYRKALDPEEARREFIKFRGKQFDPHICDVVVSPAVWGKLYDSVVSSHEATRATSPLSEQRPASAVA